MYIKCVLFRMVYCRKMVSLRLIVSIVLYGYVYGVNSKHEDRVVGQPAAITDFNWVVSVQNCPSTATTCTHRATGAIINTTTVITSRLALSGLLATDLRVLSGTSVLTFTPGSMTAVSSITPHSTDVALLTLSTSLVFSSTVGPVILPPASLFLGVPLSFYDVTGWGSLTGLSINLQRRTILAPGLCPLVFSPVFCSNALVSVCTGDAGAPLTRHGVLYGIAKSQISPLPCTSLPLFTSIPRIRSFV